MNEAEQIRRQLNNLAQETVRLHQDLVERLEEYERQGRNLLKSMHIAITEGCETLSRIQKNARELNLKIDEILNHT